MTTMAMLLGEDEFFEEQVLVSYMEQEQKRPTVHLQSHTASSLPKRWLQAVAGTAVLASVFTLPPTAESSVVYRSDVTHLSGARASSPDTIAQLEALHHLPSNWDSYGAPPPSAAAIERALSFYDELLEEAQRRNTELPEPAVQASAAGTVGFAWCDPARDWSLEVEAHPDGVLTFVTSKGQQVQAGTAKSAAHVLKLLRR